MGKWPFPPFIFTLPSVHFYSLHEWSAGKGAASFPLHKAQTLFYLDKL